jgi:hypothetical protein
VSHAKQNTKAASNGTVVIYTCEPGFMFGSGLMTASTLCDGVRWSTTATSCEGEQSPFVVFFSRKLLPMYVVSAKTYILQLQVVRDACNKFRATTMK